IAMAQIMNYYKFPVHGTGEHGYTHPKYGIQYANFGATTYNWSSMPDSLQGSNEALATLIYQCGVAQNMSYGPTVSSSLSDDIDSALVKYFGFSKSANWKSKSEYNDGQTTIFFFFRLPGWRYVPLQLGAWRR
ncbi:MAG: C10 family peptidase, partial [Bacteroidetes bacterium]|nr:C10 family peptidase [Bacteroidota bacterium]